MLPLREKCPNTEFFLVRIFLYSDQKKLRIWTHFTQCSSLKELMINGVVFEIYFGSYYMVTWGFVLQNFYIKCPYLTRP